MGGALEPDKVSGHTSLAFSMLLLTVGHGRPLGSPSCPHIASPSGCLAPPAGTSGRTQCAVGPQFTEDIVVTKQASTGQGGWRDDQTCGPQQGAASWAGDQGATVRCLPAPISKSGWLRWDHREKPSGPLWPELFPAVPGAHPVPPPGPQASGWAVYSPLLAVHLCFPAALSAVGTGHPDVSDPRLRPA